MIEGGGYRSLAGAVKKAYDVFIYGLGFETRSTKIVSFINPQTKIIALKMPELAIHAYSQNIALARTRKHLVPPSFEEFLSEVLPTILSRAKGSIRIGFDISSVNRIMLVETVLQLARLCRPDDQIDILYCPAAYEEPTWKFPQIEKIGPINSIFSSIESDPNKPLCLLLGAGFEAGTTMGLISQLEPRLSYCFWGTGIDSRFDRAVRRANFNFEFGGFNTKPVPYNIKDPKGSFLQIESTLYGLTKSYRVIIVPMGPKIFTLLVALLGMSYVGEVAIWRVQHSRLDPPDALPGDYYIWTRLDCEMLVEFALREKKLIAITAMEAVVHESPQH